MDLSGQTASASNVSTSKIRSRARQDLSFFFFSKYPKFIQPGFSWGLCGFSMTQAHLHKFHLLQLITNTTPTPQVSYISNLYSENMRTPNSIWTTENIFCNDYLLNTFGFFLFFFSFFGLVLVDWIQNIYTNTPKCIVGTAKRANIHSS